MSDITPADALRELGDDQAEYAAAAAKKLGTTTRRVLKWPVPVDDIDHPIGAGPVVLVDTRDHRPLVVFVWTEEPLVAANAVRRARVYGTGQPVPEGDVHIGSAVAGPFVWHVYAEESP